MASSYMTPGVYIEEKNAFPGSAVAVPTAVPVFIGYTEIASKDGKSLLNKPYKISSANEFELYFGKAFKAKYTIAKVNNQAAAAPTQPAAGTVTQKDIDDATKAAKTAQATVDASAQAALAAAKAATSATDAALIQATKDLLGNAKALDTANDDLQTKIDTWNKENADAQTKEEAKQKAAAAAAAAAPVLADAALIAAAGATPDAETQKALTVAIDAFATASKAAQANTTSSNTAKPAAATSNETLKIGNDNYTITLKANHDYYLYNSIQLFYANGGADCYIVSVGTYGGLADGIVNPVPASFTNVLPLLEKEQEPTLVVMPDALKFIDTCYNTIYTQVLEHCQKMQSRFAIFDLLHEAEYNKQDDGETTNFRTGIGINFLNYGAAYYPWLKTTVVDASQVDFQNIDDDDFAGNIANYLPVDDSISKIVKQFNSDKPKAADADALATVNKNFHNSLKAVSPTYKAILKEINNKINLLPPSGAMAGIYTMVDTTRGVWKAPANYSLAMVSEPAVNVTAFEQGSLNIDIIGGKSINVIRPFPGLGTLIWGGRTLDGNSQDWRYINVRRTLIMIEQSLKLSTRAYVFEPNDSSTWSALKTMYSNFLTNLWKQGALAGATPEQAFSVQVGLGSTMTANDILDGYLKVTVLLAIVRPAEFIVLTFQQQQQQS